MAGLIVLDADVLIGQLNRDDAHHLRARTLLLRFADERRELAASVLTLAEVMVGPALAGRLGAAESAIRDLGVAEIALPPGAPARLAGLRAATTRRLPDCCVLLAAEDSGAVAIATFDKSLSAAAEQRGLRVAAG